MNLDFEERLDRAAAILVDRSGRKYGGAGGFLAARQDVAAVVDALQEAVRQKAALERPIMAEKVIDAVAAAKGIPRVLLEYDAETQAAFQKALSS